MMSNLGLEGTEKSDYDFDDELFLTAVIKCEQEYEIEEVTLADDVNNVCNQELEHEADVEKEEEEWSSEEIFLQICDKIDDIQIVKVKSEHNCQEEPPEPEISDIFCVTDVQSLNDNIESRVVAVATKDTAIENSILRTRLLLPDPVVGEEGKNSTLRTRLLLPDPVEGKNSILLLPEPNVVEENNIASQLHFSSPVVRQEIDMTWESPKETTDIDEQNIEEKTIPHPPRKFRKARSKQIEYRKLTQHKIKAIGNDTSSFGIKEIEYNDIGDTETAGNILGCSSHSGSDIEDRNSKTKCMNKCANKIGNGSCPSNCSDCETDSEVRMGFNMRDVVLLTSSSDEGIKHDNNQKSKMLDLKQLARGSAEREEIVLSNSDSSIGAVKKNFQGTRKRKYGNFAHRNFLSESSESDTSKSNDDKLKEAKKVKRRTLNKKRKVQNQRRKKKKRLSDNRRRDCSGDSDFIKDTTSESDSSASSVHHKHHRSWKSKSKRKALSSLEKLVKESSPQLKVVLEDIRSKLGLKSGVTKKSALKRKNTNHKNAELPKKCKGRGETSTLENRVEIVDGSGSDSEEIKTYTKSRPVKPGTKYRYRKIHSGDTDIESADECCSKAVIEFEDSESSSSAGTCSAVPSEDISDPNLDDEDEIDEAVSVKCLLCSTLENVDVQGRSRTANPHWCKCGHCAISSRVMGDYDRVCCRELTKVVEFLDDELENPTHENLCITMHPRFRADVLGFRAYFRTQKNSFFHSKTATERDRVYHAMLSFIRWIFNRLPYGDRIMPPACVVKAIREAHMENPDEPYFIPFKAVKICEKGIHCKVAVGKRRP